MSDKQTVVGSYGWKDGEAPCSQRYLAPALISTLQRLKVHRVLDLGCGNGALTRVIAEAGFNVLGCDADREGVELAEKAGGRFIVASVYDDPADLGTDRFDAVISAEVIEHLFSPRRLLTFSASVLKPHGYLVVTTPYHGYLKNLMLALFNKWDRHADPLWEGGHIKFFSRKTLCRLLEQEGFDIVNFEGLGRFPLLWKSMLLVARVR